MFTKKKRMQQGKHMVLGVVVPLLLFLTGCTDIEDQVVGKWAEANQSDTLEFFEDGSLIFQVKGSNVSGSWSAVDGEERIKFVIKGAFGQQLVGTGKYVSPEEKNEEHIEIDMAKDRFNVFRAKNIADVIVGKWKGEGASVEFLKNGTFTVHPEDGTEKGISGTWSPDLKGKWVELKPLGEEAGSLEVTQGLSASGERYLKMNGAKLARDE